MNSIFTVPADALTLEVITEVLHDAEEEDTLIEWKSGVGKSLLKSIAAFANTYGGVVLLGVNNDRTMAGFPRGDVISLARKCRSNLEPPYEPEVVTVPFGEHSAIVVLRVDADTAPRPVVVEGTVYVRFHGRNEPADRYRMEALFSERRYAETEFAAGSHPQYHWGTEPKLVGQVTTLIPLTTWHRGHVFLGNDLRKDLDQFLLTPKIGAWLETLAIPWGLALRPGWRHHGPSFRGRISRTFQATLASGEIGAELQCLIEVQAAAIAISFAFVAHEVLINGAQARLDVEHVGRFFVDALDTIDNVLEGPITAFLGRIPWRARPPFARVACPDHQPLKERLLVGMTDEQNRVGGADFLYVGEELPATAPDRRQAARAWIEELLLDMGILDLDPYLRRLGF